MSALWMYIHSNSQELGVADKWSRPLYEKCCLLNVAHRRLHFQALGRPN
jgi:hypothetical protein